MSKLDFTTLTLGETAFIEKYAETPLSKFSDPETPKTRMMIALVVVTKRREGNPTYTTLAAEQLTLKEAKAIISGGEDDDDAELAIPSDLPATALVADPEPTPEPTPEPAPVAPVYVTAPDSAAPDGV